MANERGGRDWDRDDSDNDEYRNRGSGRQQGGGYDERTAREGRGYGQQRGEAFSRGGFGDQDRGSYGSGESGYQGGRQGGAGYGGDFPDRGRGGYGQGGYGQGGSEQGGYSQQGGYGQQSGYGQHGGWGSDQGSGSQDWARQNRTGQAGGYRGSAYGGQSGSSRSGGYYGSGSQSGDRDFWDKASDEVSSWFGDEDAERRRRQDQHRGRGPKNYARSDERIQEEVNDRLTDDGSLDASDIDVSVSGREVTLSGEVASRTDKRRAEDIAESISGVTHVQNNLRVKQNNQFGSSSSGSGSLTGRTGAESSATGIGSESSPTGRTGSQSAATGSSDSTSSRKR